MLRPRRFANEVDPGRVQIQARKVDFDVSDSPLHWIPGHPVASHMVSTFNFILPAAERWFVQTFTEALPLVKDPALAEDMRGFIGQEAVHAEAHDKVLQDYLEVRGIDTGPVLRRIDYIFEKTLAPSRSTDPKRRLNNLCDRLWLIAAIEHYTAFLGDFALNCAWDDFDADPTIVDLFRWHGSEEVEHRNVAHDVATYFQDSYLARIRAMTLAAAMIYAYFERSVTYVCRQDSSLHLSWWQLQRMRARDSALRLLPTYRNLFGASTLSYFRPGYSPEDIGSTAQAVAYLATSPAARAAHV